MSGADAGEANPDELVLDPATGALTLTLKHDIKRSYELTISITTTDGTNPKHHTVSGIEINVECGPLSTTVQPPILTTLKQVPSLPSPPTLTEKFTVTNPTCPVN
jgi:hypothetical protein